MKLLYVTAGLPFSRSETFIIPEIVALQHRGHDVTLVPVRPLRRVLHGDARRLLGNAVVAPVLSLPIALEALKQAARAPLRATRAALTLRASRSPRILAKNVSVLPKALWVARLATQLGIEHIHAHWGGTSATVAFLAARVARIPWSFTAHRWDIPEDNLLRQKSESAAFARAIDRRGADELRVHMGEQDGKLEVIHMGVSVPAMRERPLRADGTTPRVVMAAFFVEKKGHRYALDALSLLRERGVTLRLDLAGDGPLRKDVEKYAADVGVGDAVRFLGLVSHDDLLEGFLRGRWDVALLPSIVARDGQKEGIPVFLMEAMAAGLPVVATDNGGIPELLQGAGLMVPQRDATAIADALASLCRDAQLRSRLGAAGRRRVAEEFSVDATADRLIARFSGSARRASSTTSGALTQGRNARPGGAPTAQ